MKMPSDQPVGWFHRFAGFGLAWLGLWMLTVGSVLADGFPLHRGVNLSHWLQYTGRQPVGAADLALLRSHGFDHVRLPFDPTQLGWDPENFQADNPLPGFERLEQAIQLALAADLAVIVDFHPEEKARERVEFVRRHQQAMIATWAWLAKRLGQLPADKVAFELLNEPQYYQISVRHYLDLVRQTLRAIRAVAPDHWILVGGIHGSDIEGLEKIIPMADGKIAYIFHFYEPYLVTHFHAPWEPFASSTEGLVDGVLYPASRIQPGQITVHSGANPRQVLVGVQKYLDEGWGAERIRSRIAKAAQWGRSKGVTLICTEFGALRAALEGESRANWLGDVRQAMEAQGIAWTVWDYADLFGIATTVGAVKEVAPGLAGPSDPNKIERRLDPQILKSLIE